MNRKEGIVVLVTAGSREEAEKIGKRAVEERLAACCNVSAPVTSFFWWEGKIEKAEETLLVFKTSAGMFDRLKSRVQELHSYEVPEIIALPMSAGLEEYLSWIHDETVLKRTLIP